MFVHEAVPSTGAPHMIVGLLIVIIGILLILTGIGAVFGIPLALIGAVVFVFALVNRTGKGVTRALSPSLDSFERHTLVQKAIAVVIGIGFLIVVLWVLGYLD